MAPTGCGPEAIYQALLGAGFNTVQAIGLMANAMNESSLNSQASAIDSNGRRSNGLWQFNEGSYPDSGSLVTGNCASDITNQVGYLKAHISGSALQGSTGGQVAGNVAQYFEVCGGCQPGGSQYQQRVGNAATVQGWITSGNWPTAGGAGAGGTTLTSATSPALSLGGTKDPDCAFGVSGGVPGLSSLPVIGSSFSVSMCFAKKTTVRRAAGAGMMAAGGVIALVGIMLIVSAGLQDTKAGRAATRTVDRAKALPGAGKALEILP